jgi:hypothetical protein
MRQGTYQEVCYVFVHRHCDLIVLCIMLDETHDRIATDNYVSTENQASSRYSLFLIILKMCKCKCVWKVAADLSKTSATITILC